MPDSLDVDGRVLKPLNVTPVVGAGGKVGGAKKVAGGAAKRGLKRL